MVSTWVPGNQVLEPFSAVPQGVHLQEAGLKWSSRDSNPGTAHSPLPYEVRVQVLASAHAVKNQEFSTQKAGGPPLPHWKT